MDARNGRNVDKRSWLEGDIMKTLRDLEFFKEGDYTKQGKDEWTKEDFDKALENFKKIGTDIPIVLNTKEAHDTEDKKNSARLGYLKEIYRKPDGTWSGNGEFLEEAAPLLEKKLYDHKSVGLVRTKDGRVIIDHIALCGMQKPQVAGLKLNHLSIFENKNLAQFEMFSQSGENFEFSFSENQSGDSVDSSENQIVMNQSGDSPGNRADIQNTKKEKEMPDTITQDRHNLLLQQANDAIVKDMKRDFASVEDKYTKTIEFKDAEIKEKEKAIGEKNTEMAIFKESLEEKDKTIERLGKEKAELEAKFKKADEKGIRLEIFNYVAGSTKIAPKKKEALYNQLVKARFTSGVEGYNIIKDLIDSKNDEISFGIDGNMGGGSGNEYQDFVKMTDNESRKMEINVDQFYAYEESRQKNEGGRI